MQDVQNFNTWKRNGKKYISFEKLPETNAKGWQGEFLFINHKLDYFRKLTIKNWNETKNIGEIR